MHKPKYLSARAASRYLPDCPHVNTVRRWFQDGCYKVKLRSIKFGQKRLTTEQWCDEFVAVVTANLAAPMAEHHEAEAILDQFGV